MPTNEEACGYTSEQGEEEVLVRREWFCYRTHVPKANLHYMPAETAAKYALVIKGLPAFIHRRSDVLDTETASVSRT
jgi:hypothetical protein